MGVTKTSGYADRVQVGPYRIVEELARGGAGVVFRAEGPQGERVALKMLREVATQSADARRRFLHEVHTLTRLRHPHLVTLLAAGEHEGKPWLALELVVGDTLEQRLRLRGPLSIDEAIEVTAQLAQALTYVHRCGVLHRDLKPDNVLLERNGAAKLTDFGLALDDSDSVSRVSRTGVFLGTPGYWAPEQARGELPSFGPWTDVYGLGGILYACLTGRAPVRASTIQEFMVAADSGVVESPQIERPDVPAWLDALCMRCLALEAEDRPQTAEEVARALRIGVGGAPPRRAAIPRAVVTGVAAALLVLGVVGWRFAQSGEVDSTNSAEVVPRMEEGPHPGEGGQADPRRARVSALIREAKALDFSGRYPEALALFAEALELSPDDPALYVSRSQLFQRAERLRESLADIERVLDLDPLYPHAACRRGQVLLLLGRSEDAFAAVDASLKLDPNCPMALTYRGICLAAGGDHEGALADFDRAILADPSLALAWFNRSTSHLQLGELSDALADVNEGLRLEPANAQALSNRAAVRYTQGDLAGALADLDEVARRGSQDAELYFDRGRINRQLRRWSQAVADFDRALALGLSQEQAEVAARERAEAAANLGN